MLHGDGVDIIYNAYANDDFTGIIGEPKPLFLPENGKSCIDGDIVLKDDIFYMFYKLYLQKDVSWANRNAWAPCIIEKKVNDDYKYYSYFTVSQKIGVAVSDDPTGPFEDIGHPLIDTKPEGVKGGQEIDPDAFYDPVSGKNYLYWGNGYMALAELNDDMISLKENTIKVMTPEDRTFREAIHLFYREGIYYFLWSENDTRSEDYRVRYATSNSPTGRLDIPGNNLILTKSSENGIFGTGHNSTLKVEGKDEWYIVYHRFFRPEGIKWRE